MGNGPDTRKLKAKVTALQRSTASLFSLLGGDDDDRQRFFEILRGITTPAEFRLVDQQLDVLQSVVGAAAASTKALERTARTIQG